MDTTLYIMVGTCLILGAGIIRSGINKFRELRTNGQQATWYRQKEFLLGIALVVVALELLLTAGLAHTPFAAVGNIIQIVVAIGIGIPAIYFFIRVRRDRSEV